MKITIKVLSLAIISIDQFHRKRKLKSLLKEVLENHKSSIEKKMEYKYNEYFRMRVFPSEIKLDQQYKYGMSSDGDSGGLRWS